MQGPNQLAPSVASAVPRLRASGSRLRERCNVLVSTTAAAAAPPPAPKNSRGAQTHTLPPFDPIHAADAAAWAEAVLNFTPDEKQRQVLQATSKRGILNCTRQWGKSTTCAIKAVHYAHFHPNSLVLVASPGMRQSGEFLQKARKAVSLLGIRPKGDGENRCSVLLPNGARIVGLPENADTVRGFSSVGLLIIDEASRVSDDMYYALRPMLAVSDGDLWLMSTPNGRSGFFFREWQDTAGVTPWLRITAIAEECPRIPADFLLAEKDRFSDERYREEYCCEFVCAEGALFDEDVIRSKFVDCGGRLW